MRTKNNRGSVLLIIAVIVLVAAAICAVVVIAVYNGLVSARVAVDQEWSEVRNQYQRQADLIPNLVESVSGYLRYEAGVLTNVTNARTAFLNSLAQSEMQQDAAGAQMNIATGALLATVEGYPELKADTVVIDLMDELAGSQNRIAVARGRYIKQIGSYNTQVQSFPSNVIAGMFGFTTRQFYTGSEGIETPPTVILP